MMIMVIMKKRKIDTNSDNICYKNYDKLPY